MSILINLFITDEYFGYLKKYILPKILVISKIFQKENEFCKFY